MNILKRIYLVINGTFLRIRDAVVIPPYSEKRAIIREYKKKYGLDILLETGTFMGDTVEAFKNEFRRIISFELSEELAIKAKRRFAAFKNVEIVHGNSGNLLGEYLGQINQGCLFWLDGHYSSEFFVGEEFVRTAKGDKNTPIIEELKAILNHEVKAHVILIDDARCFNGKDDYPTISELKALVFSYPGEWSFQVKRDIIRISGKK